MPKEEWGTKRLCPHCATRFYDLQNDPMTCPACGAQFTVESLTEGRGKAMVTGKTAARDDDDLVEDDDDLGDDSGDLDDDLLD
ncbi:TIGR02300 family protein, partial [Paracoccus sp. (in: a-proteobacteria)]|uniref:TIGR02300 family protein n=1 Tax=Paracoccus sp. TaxID=267 RepID=UPI0026E0DF58